MRTRSRMSPCRPDARPLALLLMLASSAFGEDTSRPEPPPPPPPLLAPSKRGLPKPVMRGPVPLAETEAREDALSLPPPPKPWMRACNNRKQRSSAGSAGHQPHAQLSDKQGEERNINGQGSL